MKPPVRVVCSECLQSLELVPDGMGRWPTLCPSCGGTIDSQLSGLSTPETRLECVSPTTDPPFGQETPWTEVWQKGTLGTFNRFQIREELGDGGFGRVFKAYDPRLDRDVALKVLKQVDPGERVRKRFFREARAAARLNHPRIAVVHDAGSENGWCWVAFEYVVGQTLSRWIEQQGKPDLVTCVRIIRDLADALAHAHGRGVFHRDLKPANIMIDAAGQPHLIDFGLSRFDDVDSDLTRDGAIVGTPMYMAPEQENGQSHQADGRSDLFSLGVIFYELITGHRFRETPSAPLPWGGSGRPANAPPLTITSPRTRNRQIPAELERICLKVLAKDPADRYQNASAFMHDLDGWLGTRHHVNALSFPVTTMVLGIVGCLFLAVASLVLKDYLHGTRGGEPTSALASHLIDESVRVSSPAGSEAVVDPAGIYYCTETVKLRPYEWKKSSYHPYKECGALRRGKPVSLDGAEVKRMGLHLCQVCAPRWAAEHARNAPAQPR